MAQCVRRHKPVDTGITGCLGHCSLHRLRMKVMGDGTPPCLLSRVGGIRPPGVGIYRPVGTVPRGVSKDSVEGAQLRLAQARWPGRGTVVEAIGAGHLARVLDLARNCAAWSWATAAHPSTARCRRSEANRESSLTARSGQRAASTRRERDPRRPARCRGLRAPYGQTCPAPRWRTPA